MPSALYKELKQDVRITEGLTACMNCGICTAVCPAAEYYDYDPRSIAVTVQSRNEERIRELLESDDIWYCGQCMSCKTRCPRDNCPGMIISALRKLSQEKGFFIKSRMGRQQYLLLKSVGQNILHYGYCVHPKAVSPETHPEQGPVWKWVYENMEEVYELTGASLYLDRPGAMRTIPEKDLEELRQLFSEGGGTELHSRIEYFSMQKALELNMKTPEGKPDMERYRDFLLNDEREKQ